MEATLRAQPDRRLVALAREGSERAEEEIVRRYRQPLVRYAASIVPPQRAEDVVHDSLAKALPALARVAGELQLRPWLYAIVRNTALNDLRDAPPPHEQIDEAHDGVEQPPQALERRESLRALLAALGRLPSAQREAIVRRELEGHSHEDIALAMGVSSGAARQLIFRAREALRRSLGGLVPMPLLRHLAEVGEGGAAAGAATGGAVAAKAAVAVFAASAVIAGGVAIEAHGRHRDLDRPLGVAGSVPAVGAQDPAQPGPGIRKGARGIQQSREGDATRRTGADSRGDAGTRQAGGQGGGSRESSHPSHAPNDWTTRVATQTPSGGEADQGATQGNGSRSSGGEGSGRGTELGSGPGSEGQSGGGNGRSLRGGAPAEEEVSAEGSSPGYDDSPDGGSSPGGPTGSSSPESGSSGGSGGSQSEPEAEAPSTGPEPGRAPGGAPGGGTTTDDSAAAGGAARDSGDGGGF